MSNLFIIRFKFPIFFCSIHSLRSLTICHFQQTIMKFDIFDILSHYILRRGERGGLWHLLPLLPKLAVSKVFLGASKMIFDQKIEGFLLSYFTTDEEIFVVLNPSEKHREKQCFLILSSFSHNLIGKLVLSQKRVSKASNLIALCFLYFTSRSKHPSHKNIYYQLSSGWDVTQTHFA